MGAYLDWTPEDAFRAGYALGWRCITQVGFELDPDQCGTRGGAYVTGSIKGFRDRQAGRPNEAGAWVEEPPIREWSQAEREQFSQECQAAARPRE